MLLLELAQWKTETNVCKHLEGHCVRKYFPLSLSYSRSEKVLEWGEIFNMAESKWEVRTRRSLGENEDLDL